MTKAELINTLKEIEQKYRYLGIRGTAEELQIGEELWISYAWDFENDRSTFDQDNEQEVGGVCATQASNDTYEIHSRDFTEEEFQELADLILERLDFNVSTYGSQYPHRYLIASNHPNPEDWEQTDENEVILGNAVVITKL